MGRIEYSKSLPIAADYDVLVVGGGPAGVCAAVSAARLGASTALVERYGVLGGNLTSGLVAPILGSVAPGTMRDELVSLLGVAGSDEVGELQLTHDFEAAKRTLADFVHGAGVELYLQTPVVDALMDGERMTGVVIGPKRGLCALTARAIVDASGDGDAAYFAGARYEMGRPGDALVQPVSLTFKLQNVRDDALTCIGEVDYVQYNGERFLDYTTRLASQGQLPPDAASVRSFRCAAPGERVINTTQLNRVNALDCGDLARAEVELRRQIDQVTEFLRTHVDGYQDCRVKSTPSTLGVRETRRFVGEYVLSDQDLRAGRRFPDAVVHRASFIVDIHNPTGSAQAEGVPEQVVPYDIPYRCLVPERVDSLVLSGRCISGTHRAHASYRVMSICMAIGEASGAAAALAAQAGVQPRELDPALIQRALQSRGAQLFD